MDIGIDRISISFPIGGFHKDPAAWNGVHRSGTAEARFTFAGNVESGGIQPFVGATEIPGTGWLGKLEFNPSRHGDPLGHELRPLEHALSALVDVWGAAQELVAPTCLLADARVKRLDIARDFSGVEEPSFYVRGLSPMKRPYARRQFMYNDPQRGNAETLYVGSKVGGVRLYDKSQENPQAPVGTLRWEVECRSDWLERIAGIRVVDDLSDDKVAMMAADRWEWSAMGREVSATDRVVEKVLRSDLSPARQRGFLGHCMMESRGVSAPMGKATAAAYRRLQRDLNVVLEPGMFEGGAGAGFVGRLDYVSGHEVVTVG
ncbi:MAG: hypothetical protein NVSMB17_02280 [Candidatus Dormibacteria bacterium]